MLTTKPTLEPVDFEYTVNVISALHQAELSTGIILGYEEIGKILQLCRTKVSGKYHLASEAFRQLLVDEYKAAVFSKACDLTFSTEVRHEQLLS